MAAAVERCMGDLRIGLLLDIGRRRELVEEGATDPDRVD
jgi:hypothetical protein